MAMRPRTKSPRPPAMVRVVRIEEIWQDDIPVRIVAQRERRVNELSTKEIRAGCRVRRGAGYSSPLVSSYRRNLAHWPLAQQPSEASGAVLKSALFRRPEFIRPDRAPSSHTCARPEGTDERCAESDARGDHLIGEIRFTGQGSLLAVAAPASGFLRRRCAIRFGARRPGIARTRRWLVPVTPPS